MSDFSITTGMLSDCYGMLYLDSLAFSEEWQVDYEFAQKMFQRNSKIYRVVKDSSSKIVGYYALVPLTLQSFMELVNDRIVERELPDHVISFTDRDQDYYLYFLSINVHQGLSESKRITKAVLRDLKKNLTNLIEDRYKIKLISCIPVTEQGLRFVRKIGFAKWDSDQSTHSYYTVTPMDLIHSIQVDESE